MLTRVNVFLLKLTNTIVLSVLTAVFLETIKYRYYCIFMLMFIPLIIISKVSVSVLLR